jgi:hypothetical protein
MADAVGAVAAVAAEAAVAAVAAEAIAVVVINRSTAKHSRCTVLVMSSDRT